jgi:hypothetical protein
MTSRIMPGRVAARHERAVCYRLGFGKQPSSFRPQWIKVYLFCIIFVNPEAQRLLTRLATFNPAISLESVNGFDPRPTASAARRRLAFFVVDSLGWNWGSPDFASDS